MDSSLEDPVNLPVLKHDGEDEDEDNSSAGEEGHIDWTKTL